MDRILNSLKKENGPGASSAPALGLNTIIFKHVYWYMQQTQVSVYRTIGPLVFLMKFSNFTSEKNPCLLHGQVFVMFVRQMFGKIAKVTMDNGTVTKNTLLSSKKLQKLAHAICIQ